MNRSQYLAAIKATFPGMTARFVDGEFRVSLGVDAIKAAYPEASHAEAMARNESLAAYEMDGDSALLSARALAESWKAELTERKAAVLRDQAATVRRDNVEFHAGKAARAAGEPQTACPYLADGERAARWTRGWNEGERDTAPRVETVDMTPTWLEILPVLLAAAENGNRAAKSELSRMARLADERNAFAAKLATVRQLQADFESDTKALASTTGRASLEAIDRVNVFNAAIKGEVN